MPRSSMRRIAWGCACGTIPAVIVRTSSRREGRARGGLADHLRALDRGSGGDPRCVAHPADAVWQYRGHAAARAAWPALSQPGAVARLAAMLAVAPDHVLRVASAAANAEAFATHVVPAAPGAERLVPLAEAERALDRILADDLAECAA